jgi:hypothetical protein
MSNLKTLLNFNARKFRRYEKPDTQKFFSDFLLRYVANLEGFFSFSPRHRNANRRKKTYLNNEGTRKSLLLHFYRERKFHFDFVCCFFCRGKICMRNTFWFGDGEKKSERGEDKNLKNSLFRISGKNCFVAVLSEFRRSGRAALVQQHNQR